ncbi:MAG: hypothetical protein KJ906_00265 [Nanoarchaeota archaeon]|nr:hypothetical protein [Nanoarchaeota archaeon]
MKAMAIRVTQAVIILVIIVAIVWSGLAGGLTNTSAEPTEEIETCENSPDYCIDSELGSFCSDLPEIHCSCRIDDDCNHLIGDYKCDQSKCIK